MLFPLVKAADWPQWRGPQRDVGSSETGLLKEWPKEGPRLLWQNKDIGNGYSTVAVAGDRIYTLSNRGLDDQYVQALSVQDGKVLWTMTLGKVGNPGLRPNWPVSRSTTIAFKECVYPGAGGDANGRWYIRDIGTLWCYDVGGK